MFERFTDKARAAVILARAEAAGRGDRIRPVYMLHALTAGEGVAARALSAAERNPRGDFTPETLRDLGIDPVRARLRVLDELRHASA